MNGFESEHNAEVLFDNGMPTAFQAVLDGWPDEVEEIRVEGLG